MPKFTFKDAKEKIVDLESQLLQEIKDKKIALQLLENKGNKDTVTFFQLIGWCAATFVVSGLLFSFVF